MNCRHLQGVSVTRSVVSRAALFVPFWGLFVYPDSRGRRFRRNIYTLLPDYTASHPRNSYSSHWPSRELQIQHFGTTVVLGKRSGNTTVSSKQNSLPFTSRTSVTIIFLLYSVFSNNLLRTDSASVKFVKFSHPHYVCKCRLAEGILHVMRMYAYVPTPYLMVRVRLQWFNGDGHPKAIVCVNCDFWRMCNTSCVVA
jgi:hypothetical protein